MKTLFRQEQVIYALILLALCILSVIDLIDDYAAHEPLPQLIFEGAIFGFAIFGIHVLLKRNFLLKKEIKGVRSELLISNTEAIRWKSEHQNVLRGLGTAIDKQFSNWQLSQSESEIALFLLKGLSFKEIADIRGTSEKTVRQQSLKVYEKSNLTGRSELSAYFLEDILLPINQQAQPAKKENTISH